MSMFFNSLNHALEQKGFFYKSYWVVVRLVACTGDYRWIPNISLHQSIPSRCACHICNLEGEYSIEHGQGIYKTQYMHLPINDQVRKELADFLFPETIELFSESNTIAEKKKKKMIGIICN